MYNIIVSNISSDMNKPCWKLAKACPQSQKLFCFGENNLLIKLFQYAGSHHGGLTLHFMEIFNYDGSFHGKQSLHLYMLALGILDHTKRNCIFTTTLHIWYSYPNTNAVV